MRLTPRSFMTAMLLTLTAGFALSQEAGAPPPPAPDATAPVAGLPQPPVVGAPVSNAGAPAVDRARTIDSSARAGAPASASIVPAPVAVKSVVPEAPAESESRSIAILRGWTLSAVLVVAIFSILTLLRRRAAQRRASMADLTALVADLKPVPARTRL